MGRIELGMLAISALVIALLPLAQEVHAQTVKSDDDKQPACAAITSEQACRAREDCLWVPAMMTFQPRPAHCLAKPLAPPGIITK